MRKFKIKNRRKRKYTKKKEIHDYTYRPKLTTIVLIPPLIIIILALFSIFIFSQSNLLKYRPGFSFSSPSIPTISLEHFYPNISQLTLPEINITPLRGRTTYAFTQFIKQMLKTALAALIELDKIIGYIFSAIITNIQNEALYIANTVSAVITLIIDITWMLITRVYYISHVIILTIAASIIMVINKISEFLNQMLILIRSPFIKMGKDLEPVMPFIDKLTTILTNTADYFITTANTVFKLLLPAFKNILKSSTV